MIIQALSVEEIRDIIDKAADAYYDPATKSTVSDGEYDQLIARLRELAPDDERLTKVGSTTKFRAKCRHTIPMGSLDNTTGGIAGFEDWYNKVSAEIGREPSLVASHKIDGNSAAAYYENGILVRVLTRGDGEYGDDVTQNALKWQGLPKNIGNGLTIAVRGEAVLYKSDFESLNSDGTYENPRNLCNGIIGRKDGTDNENIRFIAFNCHGLAANTLNQRYDVLQTLGFNVVEHCLYQGNDIITVPHHINHLYNSLELVENGGKGGRLDLPYEIDGVVVAINDIEIQNSFVKDMKDALRPKHSRAIKFVSYSATTVVAGCTITIGHTGALIPTLDLSPVKIGGVTVDSVLVNNWNADSEYPSAAHVAIGDNVTVILAGDIIPKLIRINDPVFLDKDSGRVYKSCEVLFEEFGKVFPGSEFTTRPSGRPFINTDSGIRYLVRPTIEEPKEWLGRPTTRVRRGKEQAATYVCTTADDELLVKQKIKKFVGSNRKGIGIQGIGDGLLDALTGGDNPLVKTPADLYRLTYDDLVDLSIGTNSSGRPIRLGESRTTALLNEIKKASTLTLPQFLGSLGIDILGERRVETFMQEYGLLSLSDWLDESKTNQISGDVLRTAIVNGINESRKIIDDLLAVGLTIVESAPSILEDNASKTTSGGKFSGKSFCLTGTRDCLDDIEKLGGTIKSGVSKGLHYLVQKDATSTSNKTKKAEEYGVKIISINYLKEVIAGAKELV